MTEIRGLLFDLDNTLLDRTRTFGRFAERFTDTFLPHITKIEERSRIIADIIERDEDGYKDKPLLFKELRSVLPWKKGMKPSADELLRFYQSVYVNSAVLMEDAEEILSYCKKKYKVALVTNGKTAIQYGKIDNLGLRGYFDAIVVSEEAGIKKPDPAIFAKALAELSLTPEQCVFIGDHPVNDIAGAARAGINGIWMKVNQPWQDEAGPAPFTVTGLWELLQVI
ncbi:HAD family hydrolase [Paenibacillus kobensis]|uniref:HAD family hydrolase n=1 Tax=Paenibacillus kobensis TaxID=59841 RepID=UPI0013E33814|nr:HAD family hydrolase [Paenibacillus kobensis]